MERAIMCPQCNAPLKPHPFARSVVCSYCGATVELDDTSVEAESFHKVYKTWNAPQSYGITSFVSLGENHWAVENLLGEGKISRVYSGRRARWPTELVLLHFLADPKNESLHDNEWQILQRLHKSDAPGSETFRRLLPQPVAHGRVSPGQRAGEKLSIFRREKGFHHTLMDVHKAYPQGIQPRASIWVWRRILKVLSFIHASGLVHAAVLPSHLLVQENEHGMRLVGYGRSGEIGKKLSLENPDYEDWYPAKTTKLSPGLDITMSAHCLAYLLGGEHTGENLPPSVPEQLALLVRHVIHADASSVKSAWDLREELGRLSDDIFGKPQFNPITMPD